MIARKKAFAGVAAAMLIGAAATSPTSFATPDPPTNGGNGAGQSGQCTGSAHERPGGACQSGNK